MKDREIKIEHLLILKKLPGEPAIADLQLGEKLIQRKFMQRFRAERQMCRNPPGQKETFRLRQAFITKTQCQLIREDRAHAVTEDRIGQITLICKNLGYFIDERVAIGKRALRQSHLSPRQA
jgi:hypothetical protein